MKGIYKIENQVNKKVYIGESISIENRWLSHKSQLNLNNHPNFKLQKDWNIYGENTFSFDVLKEINTNVKQLLDQYILLVYEDEFINKYNSIDKGYNIERTLEKVLAGKHKICKNSDIDIPILSKVLKNIEENNGKFIVDTSKATEKICCIEQDFICKDYKEANEIYKPYTSESILNACTSGGGKVKLRTGKTLHFIYESDYATTGAKVSDIKNIKEGVKISIPATLEYSYPDFIDTSYPLNLKDFIRLLDTQNKYLLIPYTRLCAILRKNLIFEYTFTGKNKVTNKYLKLGYFIQTVTMTSGRSKYSKIKVTPIGCKFLYKLLETNKLINV